MSSTETGRTSARVVKLFLSSLPLIGVCMMPHSGAAMPIVFQHMPPAVMQLGEASAESVTSPDSMQQGELVSGLVHQDETNTHVIAVDPAKVAQWQMGSVVGALDLVLTDPNGRAIDPVRVKEYEDVGYMAYDHPLFGIHFVTYIVAEPVSGEWTAEVTGIAVPDSGSPYFIATMFVEPDVTLYAATDRFSYRNGDPVTITAHLAEKGRGIDGATLVARISSPNSTAKEIPMQADDTQKGVYKAVMRDLTESAIYDVAVTAHGVAGPEATAFSRTAYTGMTISASRTQFNRLFADRALDVDGDGLFDQMMVSVGVDASETGQYGIRAVLSDPSGGKLGWKWVDTMLAAGSHMIDFTFDSPDVYKHHVDGPFTVTEVLLEEKSDPSLVLDELEPAYTTKPYRYSQFQHQAVEAYGMEHRRSDEDGDGLFESLSFRILFDAYEQWSCSFQGALERGLTRIDAIDRIVEFRPGDRGKPVDLVFDGTKIRSRGLDGPFQLQLFYACGRNGPKHHDLSRPDAVTPAYSHLEFE